MIMKNLKLPREPGHGNMYQTLLKHTTRRERTKIFISFQKLKEVS